jgi:predicted dehydrogenase
MTAERTIMGDREPLKVAVVGTSIGSKLHVRALRGAGFEVTALVGQDKDRTRSRAEHFDIPTAETSVDAVLDTDIDAVVIATPPATHHPFTMKAVAAGKHVLCEKPFSLDMAQARDMRDAVRDAGLVGQVNHPHRWFAHRAAVRDVFQSGKIGDAIQATFAFDHSLIAAGLHDTPDWWLHQETGGGWLRNSATHTIDFARFVLGDFASVCGVVHDDASRGMSADDSYAFAFRLENGGQGAMAGTCRAWDFWEQVRITGSTGTAGYEAANAWLRDAEGARPLEASPELVQSLLAGGDDPGAPAERLPEMKGVYAGIHYTDHGYREQVCLCRSFRNRILDRAYAHPSIATFDDGVGHMAVLLAVEKSASSGSWIDLVQMS